MFGEVPITLGTVFPVGFRAAEPSRVMRIEPRDYHAVAATAPDVALEVGKLAGHRMAGPGGLQGLASKPERPRAIVIGHRWDAACTELRRFLDRNRITFTWLQPDIPEEAEQWWGAAPRRGRLSGAPRRRRQDRRPSAAAAGGRAARARDGAAPRRVRHGHRRRGPAGLAAAVYGASEGLDVVAVEREAPGGQAGTSSRIENYLGFPSGVSGDELAKKALAQARGSGPRSS